MWKECPTANLLGHGSPAKLKVRGWRAVYQRNSYKVHATSGVTAEIYSQVRKSADRTTTTNLSLLKSSFPGRVSRRKKKTAVHEKLVK